MPNFPKILPKSFEPLRKSCAYRKCGQTDRQTLIALGINKPYNGFYVSHELANSLHT